MHHDFDRQALKKAFGGFPSGVTVVTTCRGETPVGFTVSSFTSVSLTPPLLLFCIDKGSDNIDTYRDADHFAVNVLAHDHANLSNRFATDMENRFDGVDWEMSALGNPLISGAVSQFDCTTHDIVDAGDHLIIIGLVVALDSNDTASLGYYRGRYLELNA